ncbi:hypothetical protein Tco_0078842 [Tanacetum coccineum]
MPWIRIYIVLASVVCILAMADDLLHVLRYRKLWFPCKYLTLNDASLTVIVVATKITMDLNNPMLGLVDQVTKLNSMAFMCTMMANSLLSLAILDNKELLINIITLDILVIPLSVNICIQTYTEGVGKKEKNAPRTNASSRIPPCSLGVEGLPFQSTVGFSGNVPLHMICKRHRCNGQPKSPTQSKRKQLQ